MDSKSMSNTQRSTQWKKMKQNRMLKPMKWKTDHEMIMVVAFTMILLETYSISFKEVYEKDKRDRKNYLYKEDHEMIAQLQ